MANFRSPSRYGQREIATNRAGQQFLVLRRPLGLKADTGDIFITIDQELLQRPDLISYKAYGTPFLWWAIYEFNNISDPLFELKIGQIFRLPTLERIQAALEES